MAPWFSIPTRLERALLFIYFTAPSRFVSSLTNVADDIPSTMADLSRNVPSTMTNCRSRITGRMTDCSTSFFNLDAAVYKAAGKNKHKNKFNGGSGHLN
jgi:hypothetical protein